MSEQNETSSRFMTASQTSLELGISEATLSQWVERGYFPKPLRLGIRKWVWLRTEFELYVDSRIEERDQKEIQRL